MLRRRIRRAACGIGLAAAALAVSACGGASSPQTVTGPGFSFPAPGGWKIDRPPARVVVAPGHGEELLLVSVAPLRRTYRALLWPKVVRELNGVAGDVAAQLDGGRVVGRGTLSVAGRRARSYDLSYRGKSGPLVERIVFLFEQRREYQLLCRWQAASAQPVDSNCTRFLAGFTLR